MQTLNLTDPPTDLAHRIAEQARPAGSPVMYQRWEELLFLHWSLDPELIQATLPPGLSVDRHDGLAYVGVVPFFMSGVRPRFLPAVPGISNFQELNLRTYVVDAQGRPGVWFYSLDTSHRLPVWLARTFFHLNYVWARMSAKRVGPQIAYRSQRASADAVQIFDWARRGEPVSAEPGSLEFFLVERYRLFAYDVKKERLWTGKVHHAPYRLEKVALNQWSADLFALNKVPPPEGAPESVLGARAVDVEIFPLRKLSANEEDREATVS